MSMTIRLRGWIVATAITFAAGLACIYLAGGSVLQDSVMSPDRRYRVDFQTATRWQWITHIQRLEDPGVDIVVRLSDGRVSRS